MNFPSFVNKAEVSRAPSVARLVGSWDVAAILVGKTLNCVAVAHRVVLVRAELSTGSVVLHIFREALLLFLGHR